MKKHANRFGFRLRGGGAVAPVVSFTVEQYIERDGEVEISSDLSTDREIDDWIADAKTNIDAIAVHARLALKHVT